MDAYYCVLIYAIIGIGITLVAIGFSFTAIGRADLHIAAEKEAIENKVPQEA